MWSKLIQSSMWSSLCNKDSSSTLSFSTHPQPTPATFYLQTETFSGDFNHKLIKRIVDLKKNKFSCLSSLKNLAWFFRSAKSNEPSLWNHEIHRVGEQNIFSKAWKRSTASLTREWIKVEIISLLPRSKNYSLQLFQNLFRQKMLQEDNKVAAFHFQTKTKKFVSFSYETFTCRKKRSWNHKIFPLKLKYFTTYYEPEGV